jgi:hypothetical protein
MNRRRVTAAFAVLLAHAIVLYWLALLPALRDRPIQSLDTQPITLYLPPLPVPEQAVRPAAPSDVSPEAPVKPAPMTVAPSPPAEAPGAITTPSSPGRIDWPLEGRKAAARVLAQEAESARIAKMFAGPDGTWTSLTKRERSRLKRFRWKPGIDGLEYDEDGNSIYHISEGCVIVNSGFIGCAIGKEKIHGDLFKDMRLYFDEQRLPPTDEGNGTEVP